MAPSSFLARKPILFEYRPKRDPVLGGEGGVGGKGEQFLKANLEVLFHIYYNFGKCSPEERKLS